MDFKDKLAEKMKQLEKKEAQEIAIIKNLNHSLEGIFNITFKDEDDSTKNFLKQETIKMLNLQVKGSIELGKIINTVYENLANQGSTKGTYSKWLNFCDINNKTAVRYRKKYLVFESLLNKDDILKLNNKILDKFTVEEILENLNKNATFLLEVKKEEKPLKNQSINDFFVNDLIKIQDRINNIDIPEEKKERILKKIEELFDDLSTLDI